eukprot:m.33706 g.33706  ORF g.33706 m.33706 type:complete len:87 (-) comp12252_c0_seq2:377-637(-)
MARAVEVGGVEQSAYGMVRLLFPSFGYSHTSKEQPAIRQFQLPPTLLYELGFSVVDSVSVPDFEDVFRLKTSKIDPLSLAYCSRSF